MQTSSLTLSPQEALEAICRDLRRYEPQTVLCAELLRFVLNDEGAVKREPGRSGIWIRRDRHKQMQYLDGYALIDHVTTVLHARRLGVEQIAALCCRVFQTRAKVVGTSDSALTQIILSTGMEAFRCRLCGRCCRDLDYHMEVTSEDVDRWQAQGRNDILKWVGITKANHQAVHYQIWIIPGTNRFAEVCPFLKQGITNDQWVCAIEETKPDICRQYPFTRKHGVMTGCMGFK